MIKVLLPVRHNMYLDNHDFDELTDLIFFCKRIFYNSFYTRASLLSVICDCTKHSVSNPKKIQCFPSNSSIPPFSKLLWPHLLTFHTIFLATASCWHTLSSSISIRVLWARMISTSHLCSQKERGVENWTLYLTTRNKLLAPIFVKY